MEKTPLTPPQENTKASLPLVMTRDMEQQLADLNYTKEERNKLTPAEAHAIIEKGVRKEKEGPTPAEAEVASKKIWRAAVVETTNLVEAQARDLADHKMTESKEDRSKNWFTRTVKRIWKHNLAQEYYRQKEIATARKEILATGNLYAGEQGVTDDKESQVAMDAIIERFTSEYGDEVLNEGETREHAKDASNAAAQELIKKYAGDPNMSDEAFRAEKDRILSEIDPNYGKKGKMHADNLLTIAMEVRKAVAEGQKLDEMDFDIKLIRGKAEESLNTSAQKNSFDKTIEGLQNSSVGKYFMNNGSVAVASVLWSTGAFVGNKLLRSNAAKIATLGGTAALAGAMSGVKESARLNRERAQHARESAKGMQFNEADMKRRIEMEKNRYETRGAKDMISKLEEDIAKITSGTLEQSELSRVMANLADLESRIKLGDQKKVDLISYSGFDQVEKEKTDLVLARARLKVALRNSIEKNVLTIANGDTFDANLAELTRAQMQALQGGEGGLEAKDKLFMKMKKKKVAWAVAKGILIGGTAGLVAQEIGAAIDPNSAGIFEGADGEEGHATAMESLRRWMTGENPRVPFGNGQAFVVGNTQFQVPEGVQLIGNEDGTTNIFRDGVMISEKFKLDLDASGNLSPEAQEILARSDIFVQHSIVAGQTLEHFEGTPNDYLAKYPEGSHRIHRELWYDNDTPKPVFDKNELETVWGGSNGTGVDANGNFVFNVKGMTADGSYHNGASLNAAETTNRGGLKMLLSLSRGTQHQVFEVPIDANGNAIIDKDSTLAKMMFENQGGRAVFNGQFAEVAHSTGMAEDGAENVRVLSTVVGKGIDNMQGDFVVPGNVSNIRFDVPADWQWDVPPVVPIFGRRPLERGAHPEKKKGLPPAENPKERERAKKLHEEEFGSSYLYFRGNEKNKERWARDLSPRLKENSEAVLSQKEELSWYFEKQMQERGAGYVEELDSFIEKSPVLKNLSPETRIAVCMPVAAANEAENIYNTLSLYAQQDTESLGKTVIVMNLNWPNDADMAQVGKTLAEIERAKKDFPQLQIATIEKVWDRKWIQEKEGKIYGEVVKYLNDTVLRALNKNGVERDTYLLTNDADAQGMSKNYLSSMLRGTEKEPTKDGFLGKIDWSSKLFAQYPGFHAAMRMYQYIDAAYRAGSGPYKSIASSGPNFLVKASSFAAVGGYDATMGAGPDTDLGRRIRFARQGDKPYIEDDKFPIGYNNGAWVDTDPSRSLRFYKDGLPIVDQWSYFDEGGYQPRGDLKMMAEDGENLEKDFDKIVERTTYQINGMLESWIGFNDVGTYTRALNYAFPPQKINGVETPLWKVGQSADGKDGFELTAAGKAWFYSQLKNYRDTNLSEIVYKRGVKPLEGPVKKTSAVKTKNPKGSATVNRLKKAGTAIKKKASPKKQSPDQLLTS